MSIESSSVKAKEQILNNPMLPERRSPKMNVSAQRYTPQFTKELESKEIFSAELKPEAVSPLLPTRNISSRTNHILSRRNT